jgi:glycerol kinase
LFVARRDYLPPIESRAIHPQIDLMPVLALDAGTTSTRAMVFADDGAVLAQVQKPFTQHFPADGWVEHDADEIFDTTVACAR